MKRSLTGPAESETERLCHAAVQREYRSRKTRKKEKRLRRGEDEVSAAFRESQATADAAQARRAQSETLEALFEIFFRALKQCTASGYAAAGHKGRPVSAEHPDHAHCSVKCPRAGSTGQPTGSFVLNWRTAVDSPSVPSSNR